ncbi:MAG: LLM class flavin-dependent oxidoreductase [Nitrososphaeraceae archaeon]|nr:LLM class flavin-dependent oxidoreductase [Nitrososphaeraceae archaeon]MBV9667633.1 LLM class flavin-dependent oxidoreductase [Nitrososphaeraceae archaeon]
MVKFSILAAHEQVNPVDLLSDVIIMEQNEIERCWTSDHFMPWWHTGASGGAAWPWLGAALAKTNKIIIGTGITPPILRYHPGICYARLYVSKKSIPYCRERRIC